MDNRYHRKNRSKYNLKVDIVFITKYRRQLKDSRSEDDLEEENL